MYEACDLMVINKIDAMAVFNFDKERWSDMLSSAIPDIRIFYISAKTGEGVAALAEEILAQVTKWNARELPTPSFHAEDGGVLL